MKVVILAGGFGTRISEDFKYDNARIVHTHTAEPWRVTLVDTGVETMTGGRVKRIKPYVENDTFMLTYGAGALQGKTTPAKNVQGC